MRTTQEIIAQLRHVIEWSQPNIKHDEMVALVNELEASLTAKSAAKTTEKTVAENVVKVEEEAVKPTETVAPKPKGFAKKQ